MLYSTGKMPVCRDRLEAYLPVEGERLPRRSLRRRVER